MKKRYPFTETIEKKLKTGEKRFARRLETCYIMTYDQQGCDHRSVASAERTSSSTSSVAYRRELTTS